MDLSLPGQTAVCPTSIDWLLLLRSRRCGATRRRVGFIVFLDKVVGDVGGLSGEEQNARLLGRAALEHHHNAALLAVAFEEPADLVINRLGDILEALLAFRAVILSLAGEVLLSLSGFVA